MEVNGGRELGRRRDGGLGIQTEDETEEIGGGLRVGISLVYAIDLLQWGGPRKLGMILAEGPTRG